MKRRYALPPGDRLRFRRFVAESGLQAAIRRDGQVEIEVPSDLAARALWEEWSGASWREGRLPRAEPLREPFAGDPWERIAEAVKR